MDSHPVPQNVTSFQFKLVGDMTLKQFLYLASGVAIAYVLFLFARDKYPLLAWPAIVISAGLGAAFAFLPIQERPLDQWVVAFFKAVYSPTKREWKKGNVNFKEHPLFKSRYPTFISATTPQTLGNPQDQKIQIKSDPIRPTDTLASRRSGPTSPTPPNSELPTHQELKETVDLAKQAQNLQTQIIQTERQLNQIKAQSQQPTPISVNYSQQVSDVLSNLQTLVSKASEIKQKLENVEKNEEESSPSPLQAVKPQVKIITPEKPKQTQLALTTFPNVINGVVKNSQTNYLEGVVVVIYDKEGLPVRALKTNKLGQFTGSTPLPNGTYKIELEKDGFNFDVLQIELTGQLLAPLMIIAKQ